MGRWTFCVSSFSLIGLFLGVQIWPHSHLPVTNIPEYPPPWVKDTQYNLHHFNHQLILFFSKVPGGRPGSGPSYGQPSYTYRAAATGTEDRAHMHLFCHLFLSHHLPPLCLPPPFCSALCSYFLSPSLALPPLLLFCSTFLPYSSTMLHFLPQFFSSFHLLPDFPCPLLPPLVLFSTFLPYSSPCCISFLISSSSSISSSSPSFLPALPSPSFLHASSLPLLSLPLLHFICLLYLLFSGS